MAQGQSKTKERVIEVLVLAFVIITVGLLVIQTGINVVETVSASTPPITPTRRAPSTATPAGPTPTFDLGSIEIHDS